MTHLESGGGALPTQTVNKQAGQRRQVWHLLPCLEKGRLVTVAKAWHAPLESGGGHIPTQTLNKKKRLQL
jgi:hypothetical protein